MKSLLLFFLLVLSGCAFHPNTYNGSGMSEDNLAHVNFVKVGFWDNFNRRQFQGQITGVWDSENNKVIEVVGIGYGTKSHTEVFLEPGKYVFQAYCFADNLRANPHITLDLEERTRYTLACTIEKKKKAFLGGDYPSVIGLKIEEISPREQPLEQ